MTSKERLCRLDDCGKPAAEGWNLCIEHVDKRVGLPQCKHGSTGKPPCLECLVESLRDEAVTTTHSVPENELLALTALLDEHPEWWEHPCMCAECRSIADE